MWRVLVSKADTVAGQVTLGFVNTCVNYPTLAFGFFAIMLVLVCALWVEVLNVGRSQRPPEAFSSNTCSHSARRSAATCAALDCSSPLPTRA